MTTGHDPHGTCFIRRLDPRARIAAATGAAFAFSALQSLAVAGAALACSLALLAIRRPPALPLLKQLAVANCFVFFMALTVPPTMPGEIVARLGPVRWSREGLELAALIAVKSNAILLSFLALVTGIGLPLIGCALERMRVPAKLVFLFMFTSRYLHVIGEEWSRLQVAARLRGFVARNSLHTYRTLGNMLGLTFINGIDRSRRVYEAMELRGFRGSFHTVTELKGTAGDKRFTVFAFVLLGVLLLVDWQVK